MQQLVLDEPEDPDMAFLATLSDREKKKLLKYDSREGWHRTEGDSN